jgi:hypothetical protein
MAAQPAEILRRGRAERPRVLINRNRLPRRRLQEWLRDGEAKHLRSLETPSFELWGFAHKVPLTEGFLCKI